MVVALFIVLGIVLIAGVTYGRRFNQQRASYYLSVLEEHFTPTHKDYVLLGEGLGYGFDYTVPGPISEVQGVLTLLPRYTPLYLPIARLIGRQDLLKLTFHCGDSLPAGVGSLVHTNCTGSRWCSVEEDADLRDARISHGVQEYTLYFYNPSIAERFRRWLPRIAEIENLNQLSVDSRKRAVTVFLTPHSDTFRSELRKLVELVFSLTVEASGGRLD